jgi:tripartite-type tricarboxylate transporter receptor subunit TctC
VGELAGLSQSSPVRTRRGKRCARSADRTEATERLGKQFFVENIVGAGGNIGTGRGARAVADGYTLVVVASSWLP